MQKSNKKYCRYRKSLENLIRTGKQDELLKKIRCFHRDGKGFTITQIRQVDYIGLSTCMEHFGEI